MKKGVIVLIIALLAGVAAFSVMRSHMAGVPHGTTLLDEMPELAWLRSDLALSDEQFKKVSELHIAYRPKCEEMCDRIAGAHMRLESITRGAKQLTPEMKEAIDDHARIHAECQEAMIEHLYRTAEVLNEDQAESYLTTMLPYALDFSHSEPRGAPTH